MARTECGFYGARKMANHVIKVLGAFGLMASLSGLACQTKRQEEAAPTPARPAPAVAPPAAAEDPAADAKQIYRLRCTACHGENGRGDGPGAAALSPKPRMFTDAAWQEGVKDEELRSIIVKGGAAVGRSPGMPPNPDLEKKAEVVSELVKIVRGFKG